uniref:Myosin tail domain-containing protein n=1 Tax=Trichuris muris TaxID=70415 RepID=A0A5S6R692_TRIMR
MSTAGSAFQPSMLPGMLPSPSNFYCRSNGTAEDQKSVERTPGSHRRRLLGRMRHHSSCDDQGLSSYPFLMNLDAQATPVERQVEVGHAGTSCAVPMSTSLPKAHLSSHLSHGNLFYGQHPLSAREATTNHGSIGDPSNLREAPSLDAGQKVFGQHFSPEYELLRREWQNTVEKLNATMNSIKSFWSPELKKERALRKEEAAKLLMLQDQLKVAVLNSQKQGAVIEQLQAQLRFQCSSTRPMCYVGEDSVPTGEFQTVCQERDLYRRDYMLSTEAIKELEFQLESQRQSLLRKDESVKRLLEAYHTKGVPSGRSSVELEIAQSRVMDLEARCSQLESHCTELESALAKQGYYGQSDKNAIIQKLEADVAHYEQELKRMQSNERDFADKDAMADQEYQRFRLQAEKLELELNQKSIEIQALYTRLSTAEESASDFKKHLELVKESNANKEQQLNLLQADIDALRGKLEAKNEQIDQKAQQMTELQADKNRLASELNLLGEQFKLNEVSLSTAEKKIELLEETVRERDCELELMRRRINYTPAVIQEKELQDEITRLSNECNVWRQQYGEEQERRSLERKSTSEQHEKEANDLRLAITSLQKEIGDRQVFIESQTEKINDLDRQVDSLRAENSELRQLTKTNGVDLLKAEIARLNDALLESRSEIDRLLKIVHAMEKEQDEAGAGGSQTRRKVTGILDVGELPSGASEYQALVMHKDKRIEELEEALKESVSITAEREIAVAQHKQLCHQLEQRSAGQKAQLKALQEQVDQLGAQLKQLKQERQEKDHTIQSLRMERKRHLEDAMKLKEESLLAAIGEKDAHIALLESSQSQKSVEEVELLQRQKDKLLRRLKEVNAQRINIFNEHSDQLDQLTMELKTSSAVTGNDQDDDGEGIWA